MSSSSKTDVNARRLMDRLHGNPEELGPLLGLLATTYEFDATFFELDFLPTCLGLGGWDDRSWASRIALEKALAGTNATVLLMDGRRYRGRPRSLHLEVQPAIGVDGQLLHAKVLLLVYERAVRLFVGSANLTEAGYRMNREVILPLMATEAHPETVPLIREALARMPELLAPWWTPSAETVRSLALERLERWRTEDSSLHRFVWSGQGEPLWRTFLSQWPASERITSISIVSPFWSEEPDDGPVMRLLSELRQREVLADGATLRLFAEASLGSLKTCAPRLPASVLALDVRRLGVVGTAHAVDPTVLPEEVGGRTDFLQKRSLHAKIVLIEGEETALAYVGSANFTRSGWGFPGGAVRPHIEAGMLLRRTGRDRARLAALLPPSVGEPVPLGGSVGPQVLQPDEGVEDVRWPSFLREARLIPMPGSTQDRELGLELGLFPERVMGSFEVCVEPGGQVLARGAPGDAPDSLRVVLAPDVLESLLKVKELHVTWWACQEGQRFPINLDPAARVELPLGELDGRPGERLLLAYYQGRVAFEELFPPPIDYEEDESTSRTAQALESEVDTSRIQSYQMREFVDALSGLERDLRAAASGTEASMRLALLGPVSPLGLARAVRQAVVSQQRSATAGAFQLVEISSAVQRVAGSISEPERRSLFEKHADTAQAQLATLFGELRAEHPRELGPMSAFQRYTRAVQPDLGRRS